MGWENGGTDRVPLREIALHLSNLLRYWYTLRHLRAIQLYGRIWFKLARPRPCLAAAPPIRPINNHWQSPARREASLIGPGEFLFLGQHGSLAEIGWHGPDREKLWRYNQHYFDDLNAFDASSRTHWHVDLIQNWARNNQPAMGDGWEPYPTSLRIVNWVKWALAGHSLSDSCVQSLAVQARWLSKRLEIHLLGNHLFSNAKALVFAGLFFAGDEAADWLSTGLRILRREVPEQILTDGGQFERSTMYHSLALDDMLDLCNLGATYSEALDETGQRQLASWRQFVPAMINWLHSMCHPDGEISLFNDAALGIAPSVSELIGYAARLGFDTTLQLVTAKSFSTSKQPVQVIQLRQSGYIRLESQGAVTLLDVAPVGPDYLPGHAHADTLSFEMSLFGYRLIVNSGTSCYGTSAERLRQRGTSAHNTVVVDGQDSSEVWGGFRVARRARPFGLKVGAVDATSIEVRCAHDGYVRLKGKPIHQRTWRLSERELVIGDQVSGDYTTAEARFHLHPEVWGTVAHDGSHGEILLPNEKKVFWRAELGTARIEPSTYHPQFGVTLANQCLVLRLDDRNARLCLEWP